MSLATREGITDLTIFIDSPIEIIIVANASTLERSISLTVPEILVSWS